MRIISRFDDYYDGVQRTGQDRSLVFMRQSEWFDPEESKKLPERAGFLREFLVPHLPDNLEVETRTCQSVTACHGAVLFAGKLYPFAEVQVVPRSAGKKPWLDHVYSLAELHAFFLALGHDLDKKSRSIVYLGRHKRPREQFFQLRGSTQLRAQSMALRVGLVMNRRLDVPHWAKVNEIVEINPRLATIHFAKVLPAWEAFQELQMFFGSTAAPESVTLSLSDKERHEQHGFDEWSFRKPPENA